MREKGFTLIEILVVIAIIGVLSSIILVNLNNARLKANDARIKTELSSIRRAAAIFYDGTGNQTYGSLPTSSCMEATSVFRDALVMNLLDSVKSITGASNVDCRANISSYAVSAKLVSVTGSIGDYWCVDSAGSSKAVDDPLPGGDSSTSCNF